MWAGVAGGLCVTHKPAVRHPQGQRPVVIPAWASGPGRGPTHRPGLKARVIRIETTIMDFGSGLQPCHAHRRFFLGRWPRLAWPAPLVLRRQPGWFHSRPFVANPPSRFMKTKFALTLPRIAGLPTRSACGRRDALDKTARSRTSLTAAAGDSRAPLQQRLCRSGKHSCPFVSIRG
jgi:hypothetical protein